MPFTMKFNEKRWRRFILALWVRATVGKMTLPMLKTIKNKLGSYLRHAFWDELQKCDGAEPKPFKGRGKGKKRGPKGSISHDEDVFPDEASQPLARADMLTFPPTPSGSEGDAGEFDEEASQPLARAPW